MNEETFGFEDFDLQHFLDLSDSDSDSEDVLTSRRIAKPNLLDDKIHGISETQLKNKISYKGVTDILKLMNGMPGASIKLSSNVRQFQNTIIESSVIQPVYLVFCGKCDELVEDESECVKCGSTAKKCSKKNNFLVHLPLIPQICRILTLHFNDIMVHLHRERDENVISDTDDGQLCKNLRRIYGNDLLTFTLNTDGANVFSSSRGSLWPVQLTLDFLPPNIRYLPENIIVTTLYYGNKKPDMFSLLFPLAKELDSMNKRPISVCSSDDEITVFKTAISLIAGKSLTSVDNKNIINVKITL